MSKGFCHLHCHSEYSSLDGGSRVDRMPEKLKELGMTAMALTDHGVMQGLPDFQKHLKDNDIKPILGLEAYLTPDRFDRSRGTTTWHITLLAETTEGYHNLCKISSRAFIDGTIKTFGRPRARADWKLLEEFSEGIICLTGCMAGPVMRAIMQDGSVTEARAYTERLVEIFGKENVYGELQNVGITVGVPGDSEVAKLLGKDPLTEAEAAGMEGYHGDVVEEVEAGEVPISQTEANRVLVEEVCKPLGLRYVATGDVHYLNEYDAEPHDAMICIGTGQIQRGQRRFSLLPKKYHMRTEKEMLEAIPEYPEAVSETVDVAARCTAEIEYGKELLPSFPIPDGFEGSGEYLKHLCQEGMRDLYPEGNPHLGEAPERLEYELGVIDKMGYNDYFLIVWDLFREAAERGIPAGPGRGSAAGSIVAYTLGITRLCPLEYGLLFERFLNPDRVSMPDIDMDFGPARRGELIQYAVDKYNRLAGVDTAVAQQVTFSRYKAKGALRDSARVLADPSDEGRSEALRMGDRLAGLIPNDPKATMRSVWEDKREGEQLRRAYKGGPLQKKIIKQAGWLEGLVRAYSIHAAAVLIGDHDLSEDLPLQQFGEGQPLHVQYEMNWAESLGLLKMDFLGLRNLEVIDETIEKLRYNRGVELDPYRIPIDDKKTYELFASGQTIGTFQFESSGMQAALKEVGPNEFRDLIALVALYRPGPMANIPTYAARKHGKQETTYLHPKLEPILRETYGICVSADALVVDAETGSRHRLGDLKGREGMLVQGVDEDGKPATGRVRKWIDSGTKEVFEVRLKNGSSIRTTGDHRFFTENGWVPLNQLEAGSFVGTPREIIAEGTPSESLEKLRVLAYLIGDGYLTSSSSCSFTSSSDDLLDEYRRCIAKAFPDLKLIEVEQVRGVMRLTAKKTDSSVKKNGYHSPNSLLQWLRELGMKKKRGEGRGGLSSGEKFVPEIVFEQDNKAIAFFLASLWDCDGHVGKKIAHYKTISHRLALDIQSLLLRLGISSAIYESEYESSRGPRTAYQVSVYDCRRFMELIQPHLAATEKREVEMIGRGGFSGTISRAEYVEELRACKTASFDRMRQEYGVIAKNHINAPHPRIKCSTVAKLAGHLKMTTTLKQLETNWQEILSVTPVGRGAVCDIEVDGIHSFVADNVIVHNCNYQEQSMLIAREIAGFTPGQADDLRKAIGKKLRDKMDALKGPYLKGCQENGVEKSVAEALWADNEAAADYSFNKSHAACYAYVSYVTGYLKANYPEEYMASLLSSVMGDKDKAPLYLTEAKRIGLNVMPPSLNRSLKDFAVMEREDEPDQFDILFGLTAIKKVGGAIVEEILHERERGGPFIDMRDLLRRIPNLSKAVCEALVLGGALDWTGASRRAMFEIIEETKEEIKKERAARDKEWKDGVKKAAADAGAELTTPDRRGLEAAALLASAREELPLDEELHGAIAEKLEKEDLRVGRGDARKKAKDAGRDPKADETKAEIEAAGQAAVQARSKERAEDVDRLVEVARAAITAYLDSKSESDGLEAAMQMESDRAPITGEEWPEIEKLNRERQVLGVYVSSHPLEQYKVEWANSAEVGVGQIGEEHIGRTVYIIAALVGKSEQKTKTGKKMFRLSFQDLTGEKESVAWQEAVEGYEPLLEEGRLLAAEVTVQEDHFQNAKREENADDEEDGEGGGRATRMTISKLYPWDPKKIPPTWTVRVPVESFNGALRDGLQELAGQFPGRERIKFVIEQDSETWGNKTEIRMARNPESEAAVQELIERCRQPELRFEINEKDLSQEFLDAVKKTSEKHPGEQRLVIIVRGEDGKMKRRRTKQQVSPEARDFLAGTLTPD